MDIDAYSSSSPAPASSAAAPAAAPAPAPAPAPSTGGGGGGDGGGGRAALFSQLGKGECGSEEWWMNAWMNYLSVCLSVWLLLSPQ